MLLGGEPTLHPKLGELCKIAREIFPEPTTIEILTNGKDLSNIFNNAELLEENNILTTIARYNIDEYSDEKIEQARKIKGVGCSWGRVSFDQTLVDINGTQDKEDNFFHRCHHQLPCFTLRDYKIYECPFAAHITAFKKKFNIDIPEIENDDYLNLHTLTLDQLEEFSYKSKNICKYCLNAGHWTWHKSDFSYEEYTTSYRDLYITNYSKFEEIQNIRFPYSNNSIYGKVDPNFGLGANSFYTHRYNGKIDIIIPYYNVSTDLFNRLIQSLQQQTIIDDCMIYFISDCSPNETEIYRMLYSQFSNINNAVFLKNEQRLGPGFSRNKGLDNSFNPYVFFLDADDYFYNSTVLEKLYKQAIQYDTDYIAVSRQSENGDKQKIQDFFIKKEYLIKNNIRFSNLFYSEDLYFNLMLNSYPNKHIISVHNGVIYNTKNDTSLQKVMPSKIKFFSRFFTYYQYCKEMKNNFNKNIKQIYDLITLHTEDAFSFLKYNFNEQNKQEVEVALLFLFYISDCIYNLFPEELKNDSNWNKMSKNKDFTFSNFNLYSKQDIQNYLIKELNYYSETDNFIYVQYIKKEIENNELL